MKNVVLILLTVLGLIRVNAQQAVYQKVHEQVTSGRSFREVSLFQYLSPVQNNRDHNLEGLQNGALLRIDQEAIQALRDQEHSTIRLHLPVAQQKEVTLTLMEHQIFTEDFNVFTSENERTWLDYRPGIHYEGYVEGDPHSLVALSVFDGEVMGLISTSKGNLVLGRLASDRENTHILYQDSDLPKTPDFSCETPDDGIPYTDEDLEVTYSGRDAGDCVRVYIEIDDDIVTNKGGATPAVNYITGLFNQAIVLYNNESVNMMLNEIYAWVTNSPYSGSSSSQMLSSFQANTGEFNGNVGHLVSYQASGGIAVLDNLCSSNPDYRKCFSSIDGTYQNVPTYSWSVMVITHEMGHVIGSKHTHACAWNGNNTAIDGCAGSTEGNCALPPVPPEGGTIMSYCHLTNAGINLTLGFGPQPGNVIRNRVNATNNCLTSCGPPPPPPPPAYCSSNGINSSYEWIQKVVLGSINNTSGNNGGYHDYTSLSASLTAGSTYTINLTPGMAGGTYTEYWRVWIDYNGDLDWNDSGEQVAQGSGTSVQNLTFTVPSGTTSGVKRMRVSMKYGGYPTSCEVYTYGEVEDYTVNVAAGSGASCSDGIQNQGETGVDCGGPCPVCASCNDGIQNQGETGIDCGGPCQPCPTCNDGIQNQGETGIDCGGPCQPCPPSGNTVLLASYFETGWDSWIDGGSDATRVTSAYSWEGTHSIRLTDDSGTQSSMTSPTFNMAGGTGAQIQFYFYAYSMEPGEDFWVRYKAGSGAWTTIGSLISGYNFNNNVFYVVTVNVPGFVPTTGAFRIQCDASGDNDHVYIDQVTITKMTGSALPFAILEIQEMAEMQEPVAGKGLAPDAENVRIYPNPVKDVINVDYAGDITSWRLLSAEGREIRIAERPETTRQIDVQDLMPGMYILYLESEGEWMPVRFSKL